MRLIYCIATTLFCVPPIAMMPACRNYETNSRVSNLLVSMAAFCYAVALVMLFFISWGMLR